MNLTEVVSTKLTKEQAEISKIKAKIYCETLNLFVKTMKLNRPDFEAVFTYTGGKPQAISLSVYPNGYRAIPKEHRSILNTEFLEPVLDTHLASEYQKILNSIKDAAHQLDEIFKSRFGEEVTA